MSDEVQKDGDRIDVDPARGEGAQQAHGRRGRRLRHGSRGLTRLESLRRGSSGFTLVETMACVAVLGIILSAFAGASTFALRMTRDENLSANAIGIMQRVTEELLLTSSSDGRISAGTHTRTFDANGYDVAGANAFYTVTWTVSVYDPVPAIRQITFRVTCKVLGPSKAIVWTTYRN